MNFTESPKELSFRRATRADLPEIVRLLADDPLGSQRERYEEPLPESYELAFAAIDQDAGQELVVAEIDGAVVGTLQISFIPGLTFQGSMRAQIEAVRVDARVRSQGLGQQMFEWAIERARERGCRMVQLTTNNARPDALRFYERLGFVASHVGLKLYL